MATIIPLKVQPAAQTISSQLETTIPLATLPVAGVTTLQVQVLPPPKGEFWEGPGVFPACAAILAVIITYFGLQRSTRKQIDAGAARTKEQLNHASEQAKAEREHSAAQATEERSHAARQATLDRMLEARQSLYTQLIDDYVDVLTMFASMASPDFRDTPEATVPLMKMAASVNKTWLLSDVSTSHAVRDFYSNLNEMYSRLLVFANKLAEVNIKHLDTSKKLEETRTIIKAKAVELHKFVEQTLVAQRSSSYYENSVKKKQESIEKNKTSAGKLLEDLTILIQEQSNAYSEFMKEFNQEQAAMMKQINLVMAAARTELGLSGDIRILEKQSELMAARVKAVLARVNKS